MIKVNNGSAHIEGNKYILLSEFTTLIRCFMHNGEFTKEEIESAVKLAFMSDKELEEYEASLRKEVADKLGDLLSDFLKGMKE